MNSESANPKRGSVQRLREENKALARLNDASERLWRAESLAEGLDEILSATIDLLGADGATVQLLDQTGTVLRIEAQRGFKEDFLVSFREVSTANDMACGRAFRTRKPVVIEDAELDAGFAPCRFVARAADFRGVTSLPLSSSPGTVLGVLSAYFRLPDRPTDTELQWLKVYRDRTVNFIARMRSDRFLREGEERLRLALEGGKLGMFDGDLSSGIYVWDKTCDRILGYRAGEVTPSRAAWLACVHPDDRAAAAASVESALMEHKEYSYKYRVLHPDGSEHWLWARGTFLYDADGPVRLVGVVEDVTEARQQIETQRVLVAELQHRTRNLMAVVQSIAHQTLNTSESLEDFEERFDRRLQALSRVQGFLSRSTEAPLTLAAMLRMELNAVGAEGSGDRITLAGPRVLLRKGTVEMFALAIHELATNAIKHGALASEGGRLSATWRIQTTGENQELTLEWLERGIKLSSAAPRRHGFGRKLIEEGLSYSLSAQTKFELGADALQCVISLPLTSTNGTELRC